ncbi:hypothetical protein HMPREF9554_01423 [Treponema phagedenis F0421]|nr:hypothetical protein HMPREF9554_01423 [Treponema phagedenis F0421]
MRNHEIPKNAYPAVYPPDKIRTHTNCIQSTMFCPQNIKRTRAAKQACAISNTCLTCILN